MTRIAARARGYALSWAPLVVLVQLAPMDAGAQRIPPRLSERGTEITVLDQSYTIHGNTARALLDQMQALGPGRGWTGFRYRYEWSFRTRPTLTSGGMESDRCTVDRFVVRYTVDAVYPKWNRPEDAPAKLIAAWEAFEEQIAEQWRERRDYMVAFAREATREVQRIEEPCLLVGQLANNAVRDLANRPTPMQRDMLGGQTRTRLRWPPEGFEELLPNRASAAPGRRPANTRTTPDAFLAAAGADVRPTGMTGLVAGRMRGGEVESLRSFGFSDAEDLDSLTTGAVFRFPAFTEVMVSALAAALGQEGRIDLDAPLSSVLTGLDTRLGAVSLRHLLSHQSGIDDAAPQGSEWSKILDDLDDRAIFTDPGAVYSYSRYDYPLAVRALVELLEEDLASAANRWVFEPVGMENTSFGDPVQGLPVLVTAVPDLLSFGSTWIDAQARNPASLFADSVSQALEDGYGRVFEGGLWTDQVEGRPRASLMCSSGPVGDAAAIQIFPESEVIEVFWSRARTQGRGWPSVTSGHLLETLASDLGLESDLFEPRKVRGDAQLGVGPRPCLDPEIRTVRADDPGTPAGSEEWAGRYMNGDRVFELRDREGFLWLEAGMGTELEVTHWKGDTYLATMAGRPFWPFRLVRDSKNLRYSVLEGRAHIHEEDGPGG